MSRHRLLHDDQWEQLSSPCHSSLPAKTVTFQAVLADKSSDSDAFVEVFQRRGAEAIIPSKKNRLPLAALIDTSTRLATG
ncbi:hypothetical protein EMIT0P258_50026 [Pseudomonas sp. IT-P258]